MNDILSLFGLCRRANRLAIGFEAVKTAIMSDQAKAVFAASDISPKTYKEMEFFAKNKNISVNRLADDLQTISKAIGQKAGVIAVLDEGFARKALSISAFEEETAYDD